MKDSEIWIVVFDKSGKAPQLLTPDDPGFSLVEAWWHQISSVGEQPDAETLVATEGSNIKYPLRGLPFTYIAPAEPVAEEDWEAA